MATYKNTNTSDGYFSVVRGRKQFNLRLSRPLLPRPAEMRIGPLSVEVVRPLEEIRICVDGGPDHEVRADVTFTGTVPSREEEQHYRRVDGRVVQDYHRFDQIGRLNGWVEIGGERVTINDWFGARDHSWGVRPGMGGYEPPTSLPRPNEIREDVGAGASGFLLVWLAFQTEGYAGYLQQQEDGQGRLLYRDGHILRKEGDRFHEAAVTGIEHELEFITNTRLCRSARLAVSLAGGDTLDIEARSLLPHICYKGTGYDGGYNDERGLGLHRGDLLEYDVYDLSDPEDVVLPDRRVVRPWHRETGCTLTVNGQPGLGHFPVINSGIIERYKLSAEAVNRKPG
jgi:hypothetical protein